MEENLKKEIKEKYFQAKYIIEELLCLNNSSNPKYFFQLRKELAEINYFFLNLAP